MTARTAARNGRIWAITSYFNPLGYRSRREGFHVFARRLGLPLLVVEQGIDGRFDVEPVEADRVERVRGGDVMWQKERLLNLAVERLPAECEAVAWIDCDVLFASADWSERAVDALARWRLVQLFERLVHLRPGELPETATEPAPQAVRRSFGSWWRAGRVPPDLFSRPEATSERRCTCGMAWMAPRALLARHGLYDCMVLGMGDKHLAAAAIGRAADAADAVRMSPAHRAHYLRWAEAIGAEIAAAVGYVEGTAYHLWHGDLAHRRYVERYQAFAEFDFDPGADLALDGEGAWRWGRPNAALHRHVHEYFEQRREDEVVASPAS